MEITQVGFIYFASVIVFCAIMVVTRRSPVHSALFMLPLFFHVAGIFIMLDAEFVAAIQVLVYAGAIMVLFLFVVMMVSADHGKEDKFPRRFWVQGLLVGFLFFAVTCAAVFSDPSGAVPLNLAMVTPKELGRFVFKQYWLSVEIISLLLLLGLLAAIHLGKERGRGKGGQE